MCRKPPTRGSKHTILYLVRTTRGSGIILPAGGTMSLPTDETPLLLHNPRCSKSRAALALLEERGLPFVERRYLDEPLSREELDALRARLGRPPGEWVRKGEDAFAEAGLDASADEAAILDAMAAHPILIERPILVRGARAVVGRPPERVLELL
jgi:arsenate reductase